MGERELQPRPLRREMDPLPHRRSGAVQLPQLEHGRIEHVVDDLLSPPPLPKSARRLADEDVRAAEGVAVAIAIDDRHVHAVDFRQLTGEVADADAGAGHSLADDVRRGYDDFEHSPAMIPRSELPPRKRRRRSSAKSAPTRPTPRCIFATR